jgi:NAD(P)-dependent dehydrogenase (short-subunit alcohol dehydrogenase family)
LGETSEIGNVVAFLARDLGSYVTAAEIVVYGGQISTE